MITLAIYGSCFESSNYTFFYRQMPIRNSIVIGIDTLGDTTSTTGIWHFRLTAALTLVTLRTIMLWIKRRIIHLKLHTNFSIYSLRNQSVINRRQRQAVILNPGHGHALQNDTTSTHDILLNEMPRMTFNSCSLWLATTAPACASRKCHTVTVKWNCVLH